MIVHTSLYSRIYRPMWIASMIIFCLILAFGMQVPTLLGVWGKRHPLIINDLSNCGMIIKLYSILIAQGEFKRDPKLGSCSITVDKRGRSSKTALFITGFVIPCIVIVSCYTGIFCAIRK